MVRIKSILDKINSLDDLKIETIANDDMRDILVKIVELSRVLESSYKERTLNYLTDYLYDISSLYNKFYAKYSIINEEDSLIRNSYLAMSILVYKTCKVVLDTLAIDTVSKM